MLKRRSKLHAYLFITTLLKKSQDFEYQRKYLFWNSMRLLINEKSWDDEPTVEQLSGICGPL